MLYERAQVVGAPGFPVGFRNQARNLDVHVRNRRGLSDARRPRFEFPRGDGRLRHVIDDQRQRWNPVRQFTCDRQVLGTKQQVERYAARGQFPQSVKHVKPEQPALVFFVVNRMPDTGEFRLSLQPVQCDAESRVRQIHPSDNAEYEPVLSGKREQPVDFARIRSGLHGNGSVEIAARENRLKVLWEKAAAKHARRGRHPGIGEAVELPEVLVCVDSHANISLPMRSAFALLLALTLLVAGCRRQGSPNVFLDPALAVLVPPDTIMLAGVRMQQLANTPLYRDWIQKRRVPALEEFRRRTGLDPAKDVWELLATSDGKNALVLVRGRFAEQGQEPTLNIEGARRLSYKGLTMIGNDEYAVLFLNPTTAVTGRIPDVQRLVDRRSEMTGLRPALETRVKAIPSANQAWFVADVAGQIPDFSGANAGVLTGLLRLVRTVRFATGALDARQTFRGNVTLETASDKEAEQLRGALRAILGLGRLNTREDRREMLSVFDGMQVVREGAAVRFSADIPFDLLEKATTELRVPGLR
jgi:hypothetical protein